MNDPRRVPNHWRRSGDGYDLQIPEITGDPTAGYALTFNCAV